MSDPIIRTARKEDFVGLLELLMAAFSDGSPAHARLDQLMPETIRPTEAILDNWHIAVDGAKVIASTQIVAQRFAVAPGVEIRVGGIGQVSCMPGFRGKGLMTSLLDASIARMTKDGYHVSILGGDRRRYRQFGWEIAGCVRSLHMNTRRIGAAMVLPAEDNRPVRCMGDHATANCIHETYQKNPSRQLRTREETGLILQRLNLATWVHRVGSEFAYIVLNGNQIAEYGGDEETFEQLLCFLLTRSGLSVTAPAIEGSGRLEEIMESCAYNYVLQPVDMIRIFSLKSLLEAYHSALEKRLANWQGKVVLRVEDGEASESVQVSRDGAGMTIGATTAKADLSLDRPTWATTLFGPFTGRITNAEMAAFIRQITNLPIVWPLTSQV